MKDIQKIKKFVRKNEVKCKWNMGKYKNKKSIERSNVKKNTIRKHITFFF